MRSKALLLLILAAACTPRGREIASLEGAQPDCDGVEVQGELVPNQGLRLCIDHYLTGLGEAPPAKLRALYLEELERRGAPKVQAAAVYDRYVDYLQRASSLEALGEPLDLQAQLGQVQQVRKEVLGPKLERALFTPSLDPATKERLSRAERALLADQTAAMMRAQGASKAELQSYWTETFGAQAAQRLHSLEERRAHFKRRYAVYRRAVDNSAAEAESLRSDLFDELEQRRVRALDRLEAERALLGF